MIEQLWFPDPALDLDCYKFGHPYQYPEVTEYVESNSTFRNSRIPGIDKIVWVGLRPFLMDFGVKWDHWFRQPEDVVVDRYVSRANAMLGAGAVDDRHIRALHRLGYLPLEFKSLPEGMEVPMRVPVWTVVNTDPRFGWLTNHIETIAQTSTWQMPTSATLALRFRRMLDRWAKATGTPAEFVDVQGHDFSMRGLSSPQSGIYSGMGHLLSFAGTDTVPALEAAEHYYGAEGVIGVSVPATEHSVMCAGGEDDEYDTYDTLISERYPSGIVSIVSDTYDYFQVLTDFMVRLKAKIMERPGKVVLRPDSGNPANIICGDPNAPVGSPEWLGTIRILWDIFGGTTTSTGHKLLDEHIGVIYGDGMTYEVVEDILFRLETMGFASGNMVFGLGSFFYQYNTRDTFGLAMKATWVQINGVGKAIYKTPKTDSGMKVSARGRLAVVEGHDGTPTLVEDLDSLTTESRALIESQNLLRPVWRNGEFLVNERWSDVLDRVGVRMLR